MEVPRLTPEMIAEFPPAAVDFIRQLLKVIEAQAAVINQQSEIIRQQAETIAQQSAKIAELEARLNLNSRNSSKPPSSDGPAVKRAPPKSTLSKKPGGQPGHPKHTRELISSSECDSVIEMFGQWKKVRDGTLPSRVFTSMMLVQGDFRSRFNAALNRSAGRGCAKTRGASVQLSEREVSPFRFAFENGVEPTNNAAERAIRHGVIWRRQSHGPNSETGARYLANIRSLVETCRKQGRRAWDFLADCFQADHERRPMPTLVAQNV